MPGYGPRGPDHPEIWGWWHLLFGGLLPLVIGLAALLLLGWILLKWLGPLLRPRMTGMFGPPPFGPPSFAEPPAFERLRERYAAGEIDAVTFEQMWERLQASYAPGSRGFPRHAPGCPPEEGGGPEPR
ncbi:MAG TPA: SHOCT domain-containing protein [Ktedonobacterales bacterium]